MSGSLFPQELLDIKTCTNTHTHDLDLTCLDQQLSLDTSVRLTIDLLGRSEHTRYYKEGCSFTYGEIEVKFPLVLPVLVYTLTLYGDLPYTLLNVNY